MRLFALNASRDFGSAVAAGIGVPLGELEESSFDDGEHKVKSGADVRGADVYVVQSVYGEPAASADDKLMRLLLFIAALKDDGAARVTAVTPYLAYGRQDRRSETGDPVSNRHVAQLFEAVGCDAVITLEAHSVAAFDNAFRHRAIHLDAHSLFTARAEALARGGPLVVVSPDPGGIRRVQRWREALQQQLQRPIGQAFIDKRRTAEGLGGNRGVAGDVDGGTALILDDMVASGKTMLRAAELLRSAGARSVHAFAAHGLFVSDAASAVASPSIDHWFVSNSVPPFRLPAELSRRVEVIDAAPLFAAAICGEVSGAYR